MKEKVNKPRAFISYSSLDGDFIQKIDNGLRSCQIEPWRDRTEIRDGRPWLESIFEEGLPTCDVIIAYFTSNSLNSDMVAREVDAAQLGLLSDKGVSFLPYVDYPETRNKLRLDLKTLHCRVWNNENFYEILPSVVAEIWRSYAERVAGIAVAQERARRLEAELELQNIRSSLNDSAFTPQEEREFQHVHSKLKGLKDAVANVYLANKAAGEKESVLGTCHVKVSFIEALKRRIDKNNDYFGDSFLSEVEGELRSSDRITELLGHRNLRELKFTSDFTSMLRIHALTEIKQTLVFNEFAVTSWVFTEKMYRFVSWLDYHELFGLEPLYEFVELCRNETKT